jgi:hypothetical protein
VVVDIGVHLAKQLPLLVKRVEQRLESSCEAEHRAHDEVVLQCEERERERESERERERKRERESSRVSEVSTVTV